MYLLFSYPNNKYRMSEMGLIGGSIFVFIILFGVSDAADVYNLIADVVAVQVKETIYVATYGFMCLFLKIV